MDGEPDVLLIGSYNRKGRFPRAHLLPNYSVVEKYNPPTTELFKAWGWKKGKDFFLMHQNFERNTVIHHTVSY